MASGTISLDSDAPDVLLRPDGTIAPLETRLTIDCTSLALGVPQEIDARTHFHVDPPANVLVGGPEVHIVPQCIDGRTVHQETIRFDTVTSGRVPAGTAPPQAEAIGPGIRVAVTWLAAAAMARRR